MTFLLMLGCTADNGVGNFHNYKFFCFQGFLEQSQTHTRPAEELLVVDRLDLFRVLPPSLANKVVTFLSYMNKVVVLPG